MKKSEFKRLITEYISTLMEGERIGSNLSLGEFEDNIIITQNSAGNDPLSQQKVQISYNDLPKILDAIFAKVPMNEFPAEYRKSMIAKLSDGIADASTEFSGDSESKPEETGGGEDSPELDLTGLEEPGSSAPSTAEPAMNPTTGAPEPATSAAPAAPEETPKGEPPTPEEEEALKESIKAGKKFVKRILKR